MCRKFAPIACNVNFLCVHKKLRSKRLAPVLIKEMVRRMNLLDFWHAIYSCEEAFPMPFSNSRNYIRTLNPKKLIDVGFTSCPNTIPVSEYCSFHKLPTKINIRGEVRLMRESDSKAVFELYKKINKHYDCTFMFKEAELLQTLLPRDGVITTLVVEDSDGALTDFVSFY